MNSNTTQKNKHLFAGCLAGLMLSASVTALGCKIDPEAPPPPFDVLFLGTVTGINLVTNGNYLNYQVTFHVIETWKGTNSVTTTVTTGLGDGDCGYKFEPGADYLVFAAFTATSLHTDLTWPNVPVSTSALPLNLGEGQVSEQPLLKLVPHPGGIALSWRTNWKNFHLETSETMQPSSWRALTNEVLTIGHYHATTNTPTWPRAFFRLAR